MDYVSQLYKQYESTEDEREKRRLEEEIKQAESTQDTTRESTNNVEGSSKRSTVDRVLSPFMNSSITSALYNATDKDPETTFAGGLWSGVKRMNPLGEEIKDVHYGADVINNIVRDGRDPSTVVGKVGTAVGGFALDIVSDPTSYVSGVASGIGKLVKGSNVVDGATELNKQGVKFGKSLNKSDAEKLVSQRFNSSVQELKANIPTVLESESNRMIEEWDKKVLGMYQYDKSKKELGITIGYGNLPFVGKKLKKALPYQLAEKEIVKEETLRTFGNDKWSPAANDMLRKLRANKVASSFNDYNSILNESVNGNLNKAYASFNAKMAETSKTLDENLIKSLKIISNINDKDYDSAIENLNKAYANGQLQNFLARISFQDSKIEQLLKNSNNLSEEYAESLKQKRKNNEEMLSAIYKVTDAIDTKIKYGNIPVKRKRNYVESGEYAGTKTLSNRKFIIPDDPLKESFNPYLAEEKNVANVFNNEFLDSLIPENEKLAAKQALQDLELTDKDLFDYIANQNLYGKLDINTHKKLSDFILKSGIKNTAKPTEALYEMEDYLDEAVEKILENLDSELSTYQLNEINSLKPYERLKAKMEKEALENNSKVNYKNHNLTSLKNKYETSLKEREKAENRINKIKETINSYLDEDGLIKEGKSDELQKLLNISNRDRFRTNKTVKGVGDELVLEPSTNRVNDFIGELQDDYENIRNQNPKLYDKLISDLKSNITDEEISNYKRSTSEALDEEYGNGLLRRELDDIENSFIENQETGDITYYFNPDIDSHKAFISALNDVTNSKNIEYKSWIEERINEDSWRRGYKTTRLGQFDETNVTPEIVSELYNYAKKGDYAQLTNRINEIAEYSNMDNIYFDAVERSLRNTDAGKKITDLLEKEYSLLSNEIEGLPKNNKQVRLITSPSAYRIGIEVPDMDGSIIRKTISPLTGVTWYDFPFDRLYAKIPNGNGETYGDVLKRLSIKQTAHWVDEFGAKRLVGGDPNFILNNKDLYRKIASDYELANKRANMIREGKSAKEIKIFDDRVAAIKDYDAKQQLYKSRSEEYAKKMLNYEKKRKDNFISEFNSNNFSKEFSKKFDDFYFGCSDIELKTFEKLPENKQGEFVWNWLEKNKSYQPIKNETLDNLTVNSVRSFRERKILDNKKNSKMIVESFKKENPAISNLEYNINEFGEITVDYSKFLKENRSPENVKLINEYLNNGKFAELENASKLTDETKQLSNKQIEQFIEAQKDSLTRNPEPYRLSFGDNNDFRVENKLNKFEYRDEFGNGTEIGRELNGNQRVMSMNGIGYGTGNIWFENDIYNKGFDSDFADWLSSNQNFILGLKDNYIAGLNKEFDELMLKSKSLTGSERDEAISAAESIRSKINYISDKVDINELTDTEFMTKISQLYDNINPDNYIGIFGNYASQEVKNAKNVWEGLYLAGKERGFDFSNYFKGINVDKKKALFFKTLDDSRFNVSESVNRKLAEDVQNKLKSLGITENTQDKLRKMSTMSLDDMLYITNSSKAYNRKVLYSELDNLFANDPVALEKKIASASKSEKDAIREWQLKKFILNNEDFSIYYSDREALLEAKRTMELYANELKTDIKRIDEGDFTKAFEEMDELSKAQTIFDNQDFTNLSKSIENYSELLDIFKSEEGKELLSSLKELNNDSVKQMAMLGKYYKNETAYLKKLSEFIPRTYTKEADDFLYSMSYKQKKELLQGMSKRNIKDANELFKSKTGKEFNLYNDNVLDVYIGQSIANQNIINSDTSLNALVNGFGTKYKGQKIKDDQTLIVKANGLKKYLRNNGDDFNVLSKYGLNPDTVKKQNMFISLTKDQYNQIIKDYGRDFNLSSWIMDINDVKKIDEAALYQTLESQKAFSYLAVKFYDDFLNGWKTLNTVTNPGFIINNAIGNAANSSLYSGLDAFSVLGSESKINIARNILRNPDPKQYVYGVDEVTGNKIKYSYSQINKMAKEVDLNSNSYYRADTKKKTDSILYSNPIVDKGFKISESVEATQRTALFTNALLNGKTPYEARDIVNKFMFDYNDLTAFEKKYMKRAIPFYTFMRKNVPLMLNQIIENPHKFTTLLKSKNAIEELSGQDKIESYDRNEWRQEYVQMPFKVKGNSVGIDVNIPLEQLDKVNSVGKILGQSSPLIKTPIELATGKYAYTGMDINDPASYVMSYTTPTRITSVAGNKKGIDKYLYPAGQTIGLPISTIKKDRK